MPPIRLEQISLIVGDVPASRAFSSRLGPDFGDSDDPFWSNHHVSTLRGGDGAAIDVDLDSQAFAGKWNRGWPGGPGAVLGFMVDTRAVVDDLVAALKADGVPVQQEP